MSELLLFGTHPSRQIYRTRDNIKYSKDNSIRISDPKLGRPVKDKSIQKKNRNTAAKGNIDRIEIERNFSTENVEMVCA